MAEKPNTQKQIKTGVHLHVIKSTLLAYITFCLICVSLYQLAVANCFWREGCPPIRSFDILELGLPPFLFPNNAIYHPIELEYDESPITTKGAGQVIDWTQGRAHYAITKFATFKYSISHYKVLKERVVYQRPISTLPYNEFTKITATTANDSFIWCGAVDYDYSTPDSWKDACVLVLRYQEFVIYFHTTITDEMTIQDFIEVANFINKQMANFLSSN